MFFIVVDCINFLEIFFFAEVFFFSLTMSVVDDFVHQLCRACHVEDVFQLVETLLRNLAQSAGTVAVEVGSHSAMKVVEVFIYPFSYGTEFFVLIVTEVARINAISVI